MTLPNESTLVEVLAEALRAFESGKAGVAGTYEGFGAYAAAQLRAKRLLPAEMLAPDPVMMICDECGMRHNVGYMCSDREAALAMAAGHEEAAAWALGQLLDFMDATRQLFDGASNDDGWDQAVSRLQSLYNATLDALTPVAERLRKESSAQVSQIPLLPASSK